MYALRRKPRLIGSLLQAQGKLAEVQPYLREAMEGCCRVPGDDHPKTLSSINNMGVMLGKIELLDQAEALGSEAVRGSARSLPPERHWHTGVFLVEPTATDGITVRGR